MTLPLVFALRAGEGDDPTTWLPQRLQAYPDASSRCVQRMPFVPHPSRALRTAFGGPSQVVRMIPPPGSHDGYEVGGTVQCRREQCVRLVKGFAPTLPPRQGRGGNQVVG